MLKKNILNFSKITILCVLTIVTLNIRAHIFGDFAQWFFVKGIPVSKTCTPDSIGLAPYNEAERGFLSRIMPLRKPNRSRYPFLSIEYRDRSTTNANDTICYDKVYSLIPSDITAAVLLAGAGFWYYKKYWNR